MSTEDRSPRDPYTIALGQRLRQARTSRDLSLRDVEDEGLVKAVTLGSYERGDRCISARRLRDVAHFLDVDGAWLLMGPDAGQPDIMIGLEVSQ
jgi:transcriptional regulator with XRE-family HTH domain